MLPASIKGRVVRSAGILGFSKPWSFVLVQLNENQQLRLQMNPSAAAAAAASDVIPNPAPLLTDMTTGAAT